MTTPRIAMVFGLVVVAGLALLVISRSSSPAPLMTGGSDKCSIDDLDFQGVLVGDPARGTVIAADSVPYAVHGVPATPPVFLPVIWPPGFTGRWVWGQIEVVDPTGHVVATTGSAYDLSFNFEPTITEDGVYVCEARALS